MIKLNAVAVFCGSAPGRRAVYMREAHRLGEILARNDIKLVYGAGNTGLMGAVASGAFSEDGYVIGATIKHLYNIEKPEMIEGKADKFEVWDKMSDRKVSMTSQSDAICLLPGGFGTLDEFFEVLTLRQLGIHRVPIIVVNIEGFYDTLYKMLLEMVGEGFIKPHQMKLLTFVKSVDDVLPEIRRQLENQEENLL